MNRESKQLMYGLFYLLLISSVVWFVSFSSTTASCFDGKQNQDETGVDCGGSCASCDLKGLKSLVVSESVDLLEFGDNSTLLAKVSNPNEGHNAKFNYKITLYDNAGRILEEKYDTLFVKSSDVAYINELLTDDYSDFDISLINTEWFTIEDSFSSVPRILESSTSLIDQNITVNGTVINDSSDSFDQISVIAVFRDRLGFNKLLIGESVINSISGYDEKDFSISIPVTDSISEKINIDETQLIININDF